MSTSQNSELPEPDSMTIDPANLGSVDPSSVEGLFLVALSKSAAERVSFLDAQCQDTSRRQRVEALLAAYDQAGNFLQNPAVSAEPTPLGQYLSPCELPGTLGRLGPYEILEEIGRGGMGVVFRAHDPKLQRIVAVKALAPELARLPSARQRFLREARAAAAISHPHVVTIFAVEGTEEASLGTERTTLPFLVMECIVGQTLHEKIKRVGALKLEEIIRISRQMAEGLAAAHKRGLIHRDIKPANILLENGVERVKITDFGLARTTSDGGITHTGEILGTPQCMSPEQARGEIVDQRSDLFSLGCVMYTMCTGVSPFRADNMLVVMKKVCEETPTPVAQLNPEIPDWLCRLVHALLEKRPELRMQSAEEVVQCLESKAAFARLSVPAKAGGDVTATAGRPSAFDNLFASGWHVFGAVGAVSAGVGWIAGKDQYNHWAMLPVAVALIWVLLSIVRRTVASQWTWIHPGTFIVSILSVLLGAYGRELARDSGSSFFTGGADLLAANLIEAAVYIIPATLASYWLIRHYLLQPRDAGAKPGRLEAAGGDISNQRASLNANSANGLGWSSKAVIVVALFTGGLITHQQLFSTGSPQAVDRAMVLLLGTVICWLLIQAGCLIFRGFSSIGLVRSIQVRSVIPDQKQTAPRVFFEWLLAGILCVAILSGLGLATILIVRYISTQDAASPQTTCVIRTPVAENVKYVTIDGKQAILEPGGPGEWRTTMTPGTRGVYVAYDSDRLLNQERFFTTTVTADRGKATIINAEPVMVRSLTRPPGVEAPVTVADEPKEPLQLFTGEGSASEQSRSSNRATTEPTASIPLADAVEVLIDVENWPRPQYRTGTGAEFKTQVWIDEPGLVIRLKPLDFEGKENGDEEYVANCEWGSGFFKYSGDAVGDAIGFVPELSPGRYRVLVQDLDYGWELDRRGTIVIGQNKQTIHVKRSFVGQQLNPVPEGANFRWAGKTFVMSNAEQMEVVNRMLQQLSGPGPVSGVAFDAQKLFPDHPLVEQLSSTGTSGSWQLKYASRTMKLEIPAGLNVESVMISSDRGQLIWTRSVPNGFAIPPGELSYDVIYNPGFGWPGVNDAKQFEPDALPNQTLVVGGLTKAAMREKVIANQSESGKYRFSLRWFNQTSTSLDKHAVPAAERLVLAWLDGQPDVAESELLQLGMSESWEKLWFNGRPEDEHMLQVIEPGSTPGTWRMKEPPEGALVPD